MGIKKEAPKGWLHHATKDSVNLIINCKEYKDKIKDGGYRKLMSDVLKDRKLLQDAEPTNEEGLTPVVKLVVSELSDDDLKDLYDECDEELVKRGFLEDSNEVKGKKNDK